MVGHALHRVAYRPDCGRPNSGLSSLHFDSREREMSLGTILLILLVLLLVGALPTWPYSGGWGYYPRGGLGLALIVWRVLAAPGPLKAKSEPMSRIFRQGRLTRISLALPLAILASSPAAA